MSINGQNPNPSDGQPLPPPLPPALPHTSKVVASAGSTPRCSYSPTTRVRLSVAAVAGKWQATYASLWCQTKGCSTMCLTRKQQEAPIILGLRDYSGYCQGLGPETTKSIDPVPLVNGTRTHTHTRSFRRAAWAN